MLRKVIVERRKVRSRIYLEMAAKLEREVRKPEPSKSDRKRQAAAEYRQNG